jgi:hypothetical protein
MAGSYNHLLNDRGNFRFDLIENMGDAYEACEDCFNIIQQLKRDADAMKTAKTNTQQLKPKMLTRDEMWLHLKSLPTPSVEILMNGGMMMYYVNACYDYMCQHFEH